MYSADNDHTGAALGSSSEHTALSNRVSSRKWGHVVRSRRFLRHIISPSTCKIAALNWVHFQAPW